MQATVSLTLRKVYTAGTWKLCWKMADNSELTTILQQPQPTKPKRCCHHLRSHNYWISTCRDKPTNKYIKVLKFAVKNNKPIRRSAFTWDEMSSPVTLTWGSQSMGALHQWRSWRCENLPAKVTSHIVVHNIIDFIASSQYGLFTRWLSMSWVDNRTVTFIRPKVLLLALCMIQSYYQQ